MPIYYAYGHVWGDNLKLIIQDILFLTRIILNATAKQIVFIFCTIEPVRDLVLDV